MTPAHARAVLGVAQDAQWPEVRAAYRRSLRLAHPDVSTDAHAADVTIRLNEAYRTLRTVEPDTRVSAERPRRTEVSTNGPNSLVVHAGRADTWHALVHVADRLGEIGYADRAGGLLEVVVEFLDAPTSSMVLSLSDEVGAADDTIVTCAVEPLSGGAAPTDDAVTRLLVRTLRGLDPSG